MRTSLISRPAPTVPPATRSRHRIDLAAPEFQEMRRELRIDRASAIDEKARTVELSFASDAPVQRWFGNEILQIDAKACDLSRLNNGGAVLINHSWDDQVAVVTRAWIDKPAKKARALIRFSRSARGDEIFNDIKDGIRSLVSVGYIVRSMELQSAAGDVENHLVTDWQPFEVSVVAVPADSSVGVGRAQRIEPARGPQQIPFTEPKLQTRVQPAPIMSPTSSVTADRSDSTQLIETASVLKRTYPAHRDSIDKALLTFANEGRTNEEFQRHILETVLSTRGPNVAPAAPSQISATLGMAQRDIGRYSILRAARMIMANKPLDGIEGEMSTEEARRLERSPKGFFVPEDIFSNRRRARAERTMLSGSPAAGGFTVSEEVLTNEMVGVLRPQSFVMQLGARIIPGLSGDISIPRVITGSTMYWVSESGTINRSNATFGQIVMKPRRLGGSVQYTKEFLSQTSLDAESFLQDDLNQSRATELDRVAINGAGGVEPLGILNLASADRSSSVTFGAAATLAKLVEFEGNVGTNNALTGTPAYLTTWGSKSKWKAIQRFPNAGVGLWNTDEDVNGYRGRATAQFPSSPTANQVIFGDFSQVVYGEWVGNDVIIDPYTGKREGIVEITLQKLMDMVVRQAKSFSISTDTGAA
jgi:HK97 family phage major capsid protein